MSDISSEKSFYGYESDGTPIYKETISDTESEDSIDEFDRLFELYIGDELPKDIDPIKDLFIRHVPEKNMYTMDGSKIRRRVFYKRRIWLRNEYASCISCHSSIYDWCPNHQFSIGSGHLKELKRHVKYGNIRGRAIDG